MIGSEPWTMYMTRFAVLLFLVLRALPSGAAMGPPVPEIPLEADEAPFRGGGIDAKSGATGGHCLGGGWGSSAEDTVDFTFSTPVSGDRALGIRYAYDREQYLRRYPANTGAHDLKVFLDGHEVAPRVACPDTGDWNVFTYARVPLGPVSAGTHLIRLAPVAPNGDMNIDLIVIADSSAPLDTRVAHVLPGHSRHFRIRLGPHVDASHFPLREAFANLEAQYAYLHDWVGFDPPRLGLLTVLSANEWTVDATALTNQGNIYMQEREVTTPGNNYAHEMFHFFEEGLGYATWWSEGMAYLSAFRSDTEVYGRPPEQVEADTVALRKWWRDEGEKQMVRKGVNVLQRWGSDSLPSDVSSRALYRTANLLMTDLWQQEGDALFRRMYADIQSDLKTGRYALPKASFDERNRLLLQYVGRAAGHDMKPFWHKWSMDVPDDKQ